MMDKDDAPQKPRRVLRTGSRVRDDDVGYGKPPKAHQFKSGKSGNPKGRPKAFKPRNLRRDLQEVYLKEVSVKDGDSQARMSRVVLLYETLLRNAIKGDARSASLAVKLADRLGVMHIKDEIGMDLSKLTVGEREQVDNAFHLIRKARNLK